MTHYGAADYDKFMAGGLYERLAEDGLIVPHTEEAANGAAGLHKMLTPERVPFISYPYEWSFAQLKDAALLTLRIERIALEFGMSLKDASAFNVQFHKGGPMFIDTLSFETNDGGPWPAYGQFCRHFLAPLLLCAKRDPSFLKYLTASLDGIPLPLASSLLPKTTYLSFSSLIHIHLHSRSEQRYAAPSQADAGKAKIQQPAADRKKVLAESLSRTVESLDIPTSGTEWAQYYSKAGHYSSQAHEAKKKTVGEFIDQVRPGLIYDLGGNIGEYSRLATSRGIDTVCWDIDPLAVHQNYQLSRKNGDERMLPLVLDLSNPTPALGFDLDERFSFKQRQRPDLILALALIHHLRITCNVPLRRLAEFFREMTDHLVIEFVPKADPMVQALLANRKDTFLDYSEERFNEEFRELFAVRRAEPVPETVRTLYLLEAKT